MKGTFNQGWWNCFESFAWELQYLPDGGDEILTNVLKGAAITKREAQSWIEQYMGGNMRLLNTVRYYWLQLK